MRTVEILRERRERLGYSYRSDAETVYVMDVSHHSVAQHEALCKSIVAPKSNYRTYLPLTVYVFRGGPVISVNGLCILTVSQTVRYLYFKENCNIRWHSSGNQDCT